MAGTQQPQQELIQRLRRRLQLSSDEATDEEVLERTRGTFVRAWVELELALVHLGHELRRSFLFWRR